MPPKFDDCQDQVIRTLRRAGWEVSIPPLLMGEDGFFIYVDLLPTQENGERRYIEIKCFLLGNRLSELYMALGQYSLYRPFFTRWNVSGKLYLAIPFDIYESTFSETALQALTDLHVSLLVVDTFREELIGWIDH